MFRRLAVLALATLISFPMSAVAAPRTVSFAEFDNALVSAVEASGVFQPGTALTVTRWHPPGPGTRRATWSTYTARPDGSLSAQIVWTPDGEPDPEFFPGYGSMSMRCTAATRCWLRVALDTPPATDSYYPERIDGRWHALEPGSVALTPATSEVFRQDDMESWYPGWRFTYTIDELPESTTFVSTFGYQAGDPVADSSATTPGETYSTTWIDTLTWTVSPGRVEWTERQSKDGATTLIQRQITQSHPTAMTVRAPRKSTVGGPARLGYLIDGTYRWNPAG